MTTPDSEDWLGRNDLDGLIANYRGVAFAAFGSTPQIAALLGLSLADAEAFQLRAEDDLAIMKIEAKRRREKEAKP
jgi:hypothetical protein